jgi:V/A-type H+-transporting ATPase subunit I
VIVSMQKIRILAPRARAESLLRTLQRLGVVHVCPPALDPPLPGLALTPRQRRHIGYLQVALSDAEEALDQLRPLARTAVPPRSREEPLTREVRLARRARRIVAELSAQAAALESRREQLVGLARAFDAFVELALPDPTPATRSFYLVLDPRAPRDGASQLAQSLAEQLGPGVALRSQPLATGEVAVAVLVDEAQAVELEAMLPELGVRELELPGPGERASPTAGRELIRRRLAALAEEQTTFEARRQRLAEWLVPGLARARGAFLDTLAGYEALQSGAATDRLFVLEGWLPESERASLDRALAASEGGRVVVEDLGRETWSARDAPVAIRNPRLFRPFELITSRLPLPRYGTMDPTPFVAVFFPMFFGLILGDLGYGAVLALLAGIGWLRTGPGSLLRSLCEIAAACAAFSLIFGFLFGELFGDLGRRWLGLRVLAFSREEAFIPFLCLAVAIGFVHVVLGLVVGALTSFRSDPRESAGRGLAALMIVLTAAMLLAALNVLPGRLFTPAAIALLVAFPVLIALEGVLGPVELLSRLGNILSYARIMALGTASVMLAVAANHMAGMLGGVAVGVLFATLFHLVNFGLGVFSPTVHSLRLHFVEFFGTFYSPGGTVYRPLRQVGADGI